LSDAIIGKSRAAMCARMRKRIPVVEQLDQDRSDYSLRSAFVKPSYSLSYDVSAESGSWGKDHGRGAERRMNCDLIPTPV
jgi:hypothetical protein